MAAKTSFQGHYLSDSATARAALRIEQSFDLKEHRLTIAEKSASLFFVDGLVNGSVFEKVMEFLLSLSPDDFSGAPHADDFVKRFVPYIEVNTADTVSTFVSQVMSGISGLVIDGYNKGILIEIREYPVRGLEEPENDRVLRGAHDGFAETLQFNTALIRRRIRDPRLTMECLSIGTRSQTDVALCYMDGIAQPDDVQSLRKKLKSICIPALSMGQESLAECIAKKQWYNPFPRIRYTERPDAAAASLSEGRILVLVDNSPAAMILPTALFDFSQDTNDYYFPPIVGSYLRFVRSLIFMLTLFLTPIWYLLVRNPDWIPSWLEFICIQEPLKVPLLAQLLILELMIDALKLASLNTPSSLSNAFGLIGALILGEFAVSAGLFAQETLLYMSFVAIANFTQPSFELGYAFKLFRIVLIVLIALFDWVGLAVGLVGVLCLMATTKTPIGHYLYPLIPFNGTALARLLWRHPIDRNNS